MKKTAIDNPRFSNDIIELLKQVENLSEEYSAFANQVSRLHNRIEDCFEQLASHEELMAIITKKLKIDLKKYYATPKKTKRRPKYLSTVEPI